LAVIPSFLEVGNGVYAVSFGVGQPHLRMNQMTVGGTRV
jgi:hypothetical protein